MTKDFLYDINSAECVKKLLIYQKKTSITAFILAQFGYKLKLS